MRGWSETLEIGAVHTDALEVVIPPRNLDHWPARVLTVENAAGGAALVDLKIEHGPTEEGPWFAEDLSGSTLPTLAAGANGVWRGTRYDRCVRVRAQAAVAEGKSCTLTLHLDALPV